MHDRTAAGQHAAGRGSGSRRLLRRSPVPDADHRRRGRAARRARVAARKCAGRRSARGCEAAAGRLGNARARRRCVGPPARQSRPAGVESRCAAVRADDQPARPRTDPSRARRRRPRDQRPAHRRTRPADGPLRRLRRRQIGAARHDGPLYERRSDRDRPDRRTWPRSEGIHRADPRRGRARTLGRRRRAGRRVAAPADAGRRLRDVARGIFPRPGQARAAADGFADALRDGAARDRARDRRTARDQGLSAVGVREAAGARRAHRQRPGGRRLDHRVLYRADRRRRPAGSDRGFRARDPRRPHRAVARARGSRPLSGNRYRSVDQPRDDGADRRCASRPRASVQADAVALPAQPGPDRGGRVRAGPRRAARPRDCPYPRIEAFLQQGFRECAPFAASLAGLDALFNAHGG